MSEPKFPEPILNEQSIILPEHKPVEILAAKMYLILCFRQDENLPFGYQLMRGAQIFSNELPDYYRYYLLPN